MMSGIMVTTLKSMPFQGNEEVWSNVYFFGDGGGFGATTDGEAEQVIDFCIAQERSIHANHIKFLGGSARQLNAFHKPVSGEALFSKELTPGTVGTAGTATSGMYRECAVMVRWLLGGRRYLRSFYHTCLSHGYDLEGDTAITGNPGTQLITFAEAMLNTVTAGYRRRSPSGEAPSAVGYHKYLEHRQFHKGPKHRLFYT